jgi:hypothetical protein
MTNVESRMTKEAAKTVANATLIGRNRAAKLRSPLAPERASFDRHCSALSHAS